METKRILDYLQTKSNAIEVDASMLVGMEVMHFLDEYTAMGNGVIIAAMPDMVTVKFDKKTKSFAFPSAFKSVLSSVDPEIQNRLSELGICPPDCTYLEFHLMSNNTYEVRSCIENMEEVIIPARHKGFPVTSVSYSLFEKEGLKTVTIPACVTKIGQPFNRSSIENIHVDKSNSKFRSSDGVLYSKGGMELFFYPCGRTEERFVIPNHAETINEKAFIYNNNIKELHIGKGIRSICDGTIAYCSALKEIRVAPENRHYAAKNGVLYSKDGKKLIAVPHSESSIPLFAVDRAVEEICDGAFEKCMHIHAIYVGRNVKTIGEAAFSGCNATRIYFSEFTLPKEIEEYERESYQEHKWNNYFPGYSKDFLSEDEFFSLPVSLNSKKTNDVEIFDCFFCDSGTFYTDAVIGGKRGSKIELYCNQRNIPFVAIENTKEDIRRFFTASFEDLISDQENGTNFVVTNEDDGYRASLDNGVLTFTATRPGAIIKNTSSFIPTFVRERVTKIVIGEGIEKILYGAIAGEYCNLEEFFIGKDVNRIAVQIFMFDHFLIGHDFEKLASITVDKENKYYKSVDGVLYTGDMKILVKYPPNRPGRYYEVNCDIAPYAFEGAKNIMCIKIGENCETVGEKAFFQIFQYLHVWFDKCVTRFEDYFPICTIHKAYAPPRRDDLVIGGYENSYVHERCKEYGVYFLPIEEESEIRKFMACPLSEKELKASERMFYSARRNFWSQTDPYYAECKRIYDSNDETNDETDDGANDETDDETVNDFSFLFDEDVSGGDFPF